MSDCDTLPNGWAWIQVADLAPQKGAITDGPFGSNLKTAHYTHAGPRVVRLHNISEFNFVDERAHVSIDRFEKLKKHEVLPGDVLVGLLGDKLPRACVAPATLGPAIVKADCVRLRLDQRLALPRFAMYALNAESVRDQAKKRVHGVGRPRLRLKDLKALRLPMAPLGEQGRLVSCIESYMTRLDDAVASLERVRANLKRYRASVLKAAVEGRLVPTEAEVARKEGRDYEPARFLLGRILHERRRRWEEAELVRLKANGELPKDDRWKKKYREPAPTPDTSGLPDLPEGWCWATIDQLAYDVRYGSSAKAELDMPGGVPILRMGNIVDGVLDFNNLKYLPPDHEEFPDLLLKQGDLLFNRTNSAELVGKTAVFHAHVEPCSFASYLIRVRFAAAVLPEFVAAFLNSIFGRMWIGQVVSQQVGQANVNGSKLKACALPLPPQHEQSRISTALDEAGSVIGRLEVAIREDLAHTNRLHQAILRWAFEGSLVDQHPNDEPAWALLERIKARHEGGKEWRKSGKGRKASAA